MLTALYSSSQVARTAAMTLASKNGYQAVGMQGAAGELKVCVTSALILV